MNHEKTKVVILGDKSKHQSLIKFNDQSPEVVDFFFQILRSGFTKIKKFLSKQKNMLLSRQGRHCLVYIEK